MKRRLCFLACSFFACALPLVTAAADASAQTSSEPTPAPSGEETRHTGFFLRLGVGGGGFHDSFSLPFLLGTQFSGTATGATGSFEISAGYAVRPGLIIGGGVYADQVVSPKITFEGNPVTTDIHVGTLVMVGPFVDWYPKAGNFHFGGAITGARITLQDNSGNLKNQSPVGAAVVAEVGYDFPFTDDRRWALGIMARFVGGYLKDDTYNHQISAGSLLINVTFN